MQMTLYDIDYFRMNLNVLESANEGEFLLANKLRFRRYYVNNRDGMFTFCTEIVNVEHVKFQGSIGMVHGAV